MTLIQNTSTPMHRFWRIMTKRWPFSASVCLMTVLTGPKITFFFYFWLLARWIPLPYPRPCVSSIRPRSLSRLAGQTLMSAPASAAVPGRWGRQAVLARVANGAREFGVHHRPSISVRRGNPSGLSGLVHRPASSEELCPGKPQMLAHEFWFTDFFFFF